MSRLSDKEYLLPSEIDQLNLEPVLLDDGRYYIPVHKYSSKERTALRKRAYDKAHMQQMRDRKFNQYYNERYGIHAEELKKITKYRRNLIKFNKMSGDLYRE